MLSLFVTMNKFLIRYNRNESVITAQMLVIVIRAIRDGVGVWMGLYEL